MFASNSSMHTMQQMMNEDPSIKYGSGEFSELINNSNQAKNRNNINNKRISVN